MVCGVYICSVCLKQISTTSKIKIEDIQVIERPIFVNEPKKLQIPIPHFPYLITFSRAEFAHNPVRYFAILSMQRSGSGWLETLLNSHINVSSDGEIFLVLDRRRNASSVIETLDRVLNLDRFTSASKNECSAAVGFKWMLNQERIPVEEVFVQLNCNKEGLSYDEGQKRLHLFGTNKLEEKKESKVLKFLGFTNI
ncbi:uncharacterized protein [Euphorbia lathyris]|uniref:uncharacterized protein isoform X2 n=1 Tax=Euphorbia lathyris TaxID=212925 RepID=UPI0033141FFA